MKKKTKIIISSVLCLLIIGVGIFSIYNNTSSLGEQKSKEFIKSINLLKNENYIEAYNNIKNSSNEEKDIIQTIILYKFGEQIDLVTDINKRITEQMEHITDYLTYTYLYSKDTKYQKEIDKIYDEEYPKLYDIKTKIPLEIMFDDTKTYYNLYFEYLDLNNGIFKNCEYNIINNKDELLQKKRNC